MEILGTHFSLSLGAWRLRFSIAIEDTDLQVPTKAATAEPQLRIVSSDKHSQIFPNRR